MNSPGVQILPSETPLERLSRNRRRTTKPRLRPLLGHFLSLIATWVQRVAVRRLVWELTGSGTWLGIVAAAELCPAIVIGPLAGTLADRLNPHGSEPF